MAKKKILIIDDVEINREITAFTFNKYDHFFAGNGIEALEVLKEHHNEIEVMLLDLVMPEMDGFQFLAEREKIEEYKKIPVVVITGDETDNLESTTFNYDIADFVRKPFNAHVVNKRVGNLVKIRDYERGLEDTLEAQTKELEQINSALIESISNIVESRNLESGLHIKRVKTFVNVLASYVKEHYPEYGLTDADVEMITVTSALHDIGKIVIPDSILLKPGKLTEYEFDEIKKHTTYGGDIIDKTVDFKSSEYAKCAHDIVLYHHERYDGKGYPCGLKGEEIPISAQIVGVADVLMRLFQRDATRLHMIMRKHSI